MNLSSAFSSYDSYPIKNIPPGASGQVKQGHRQIDLRLDQMITLGVFKSTSGTIKKMLHAPTLKIYAVKEVPIANVQVRQMLIDWMANWQHNCCFSTGGSQPNSA